ncbi:site-specific integrase [uncultured Chitinophaga sp.]|uniref:site-specific integrase n=1 Tax=uncultured Chitinophaga sp. TaxID=339340 RepID=UPI0025E1A498|nr:site-specific integrase [uncultured Chitinophaga sp.]
MKVSQELSILFWLRKQNNNGDARATIMVRITIEGIRENFSLGYQVLPEKFDSKAGAVLGRTEEAATINRQLVRVRSELLRHYYSLKDNDKVVTSAILKNAYLGIDIEKKTFLQVADYQYALFEKKVEKNKMSYETLRKWKSTRNKLAAFIKHEYKLPDLPLDRVKYSFAEDLYNYLTLTDGIEDNTAMKYVKQAKQIITVAVRRDWLQKNPLDSYKCTYIDPDRDILNAEELAVLLHKELPVPRLQEAKDIYLFMAFTGYAYKDTLNLTPDHIAKFFDGEDWIVKNREKTWCRENVPLLPHAKEILKKYKDHPYCVANNRLFPVRSNQRFNSYLKEIADVCSISKNLTTHTARHTFATTVTLANNVPLETVSALLGHKSIRTTQIYARIVASKVSADMKSLKSKISIELPASLLKPNAA